MRSYRSPQAHHIAFRRLVPLAWLAFAWLACTWVLSSGAARATVDPAIQMALGNPSHATTSVLDETDYLIVRPQYALSYSRYDGICRWVSWHLSSEDIGSSGRGDYAVDTSLPAGWTPTPTQAGWSAAGYDRGHMCPSGDRTLTEADNKQVFLMTNLIPQGPGNNQGPWNNLENYCRDLARAGNELYIICGGRGFRETITYGAYKTTAPAYTWKVIVVLPKGDNDIARISATTRVIAVDMPNIEAIRNHDWKNYRTTVDAIEGNTGLDFLSNVPTAIQNALEGKVDAL